MLPIRTSPLIWQRMGLWENFYADILEHQWQLSFYYWWSSVTTTLPCSAQLCSSKKSSYFISVAACSPPSSCIWILKCGALGKLQVTSVQLVFRGETLLLYFSHPHHWQCSFSEWHYCSALSDTTALQKWQQQLLPLPSILPRCLHVCYCQLFSDGPFAIIKVHRLWRDSKTYAFQLLLSKGRHRSPFVLIDMPLPWAFAPYSVWHCWASHKHRSFFLARAESACFSCFRLHFPTRYVSLALC